jgi:TetR/AcrR family transcriptional regulator, transcriptional repressor for nem operon
MINSGLYSPEMARTKAFSPHDALSTAVELFWDLGYEKTSLDMLMSETGVARQSLYDTFGDKRSLYLKALAHYRDTSQAQLRRLFASGHPIRACFSKLLRGIATESKAAHLRGCLLLSANLEREAGDKTISDFLKENQAQVEGIFRDALRRARDAGDLPVDRDPDALARFFLVTVQGMRSTARVHSNRAALQQVARVALAALG